MRRKRTALGECLLRADGRGEIAAGAFDGWAASTDNRFIAPVSDPDAAILGPAVPAAEQASWTPPVEEMFTSSTVTSETDTLRVPSRPRPALTPDTLDYLLSRPAVPTGGGLGGLLSAGGGLGGLASDVRAGNVREFSLPAGTAGLLGGLLDAAPHEAASSTSAATDYARPTTPDESAAPAPRSHGQIERLDLSGPVDADAAARLLGGNGSGITTLSDESGDDGSGSDDSGGDDSGGDDSGSGGEENCPPVAYDDSGGIAVYETLYTVPNDACPSILDNDYDPDGDPISVADGFCPGWEPEKGALTLHSDGSFEYMPNTGMTGEDCFSYRATDGTDESDDAWVGLEIVRPVPNVETAFDGASGESGGGDPEEYEHESPGNIIRLNDDDEDGDGTLDYADEDPLAYPDGDLEPITVSWDTLYADLEEFTFTFEQSGDGSLKVWDTATKQHNVTNAVFTVNDSGSAESSVAGVGPLSGGGHTFYVEGCATGEVDLSWVLKNPVGREIHRDTARFTVLKVNLTIYNGQAGAAVAELLEEKWGAFTVANRNDTDGDGVTDMADNSVVGTPHGRDEVDLMQLDLHKPTPDLGGSVTLWVDPVPELRLWADSTKTTEIPITTEPGSVDGYVTFLTSDLDKTVYVELTGASVALRDYTMELRYCDVKDTVKATAVWSQATAIADDNATYATLVAQPEWADMDVTDPPKTTAQAIGTGLSPIPIALAGQTWVGNGIWFRFTVTPPGIQFEPGVEFDAARRVEWNLWALDTNWELAGLTNVERYPEQNEEPNDDGSESDESAAVNANGYMFSVDAPGPADTVPAGFAYEVEYFNAEEFLRVVFDGSDPAGDGVAGSRVSPKIEWKLYHTLQDDGTGHWERTTGDASEVAGENQVELGRIIDLGDPTEPPPRP